MTLVSPSRTIQIAGKSYTLNGSFTTLRTVQEVFNRDIVRVLIGIMDMRPDEIADLIAIGSGQRGNENEIGQDILDSIGVLGMDYAKFKTELIAWLSIAVSPKSEREKKRAEMEAILAQMNSPGPITSDFASGSSSGDPVSSGDPTSGK